MIPCWSGVRIAPSGDGRVAPEIEDDFALSQNTLVDVDRILDDLACRRIDVQQVHFVTDFQDPFPVAADLVVS